MLFLGDSYEKFVATIAVQTQNLPKEVQVEFKSDCKSFENGICSEVPSGQNVKFTAIITLSRSVIY